MLFSLQNSNSGYLQSGQDGTPCLALSSPSENTALTLVDCNQTSDSIIIPAWLYNQSSRLLHSTTAPFENMCLGLNEDRVDTNRTNVWVRELVGNVFAVYFINVGEKVAEVVCGPSCFGEIGFKTSDVLSAYDVWTHSRLPDIIGTTFRVTLDPNGGSALITVKKKLS